MLRSSLLIDLDGQVGADARAVHAGYAAAFLGVLGRVIAGLGEFIGLFNALLGADLYAKVAAFAFVHVDFHLRHRTSGVCCGARRAVARRENGGCVGLPEVALGCEILYKKYIKKSRAFIPGSSVMF
jgi:hypothetical protein